ncbi:unnamed protein product [Sympodiomycopsis kandeliae]
MLECTSKPFGYNRIVGCELRFFIHSRDQNCLNTRPQIVELMTKKTKQKTTNLEADTQSLAKEGSIHTGTSTMRT